MSLLVAGSVFGDDWAQFCGPRRNNISAETGLSRSWPDAGPKELWSAEVTSGYSGPSIKDGKVYLLEHDAGESSLRCLSFDSGKELWRCSFNDPGAFKNKQYPGTRGTPTVTDDSAYAVTHLGTMICVDLASHKIKWQRNLVEEFGRDITNFGVAQSPLLAGDLVVVAPLSKEHSVVALDRKTGQERWTVSGLPGTGYVSPMGVVLNGESQILMVAGCEPPKRTSRRPKKGEEPEVEESAKDLLPTVVFSISPKDGKVLWRYEGWSCQNPIPHPIVVNEDTIFITSGYKSVSTLLQVKKLDGKCELNELFKTEKAASQIEQPLLVNDHLFIGGTVKVPRKGFVCIDLKGNVKWDSSDSENAPKFADFNMISADGLLIGLDGTSGMLYLIEASPDELKVLASAKVVMDKGQNWAPIALSDGKLLVRDHNVMKCLKLK
jgi:outer membrane protein assembly factor BamB